MMNASPISAARYMPEPQLERSNACVGTESLHPLHSVDQNVANRLDVLEMKMMETAHRLPQVTIGRSSSHQSLRELHQQKVDLSEKSKEFKNRLEQLNQEKSRRKIARDSRAHKIGQAGGFISGAATSAVIVTMLSSALPFAILGSAVGFFMGKNLGELIFSSAYRLTTGFHYRSGVRELNREISEVQKELDQVKDQISRVQSEIDTSVALSAR